MSLFKKKSSAEYDDQEKESPANNRGALLVLLILLGGFAYLYFFTSLIVTHEAPPVVAPAGAPEIKQSMPPKPSAQPPGSATVAKKAEEAKPVTAPVAVPVAAKPAVVPAPVAVQPPPVAKPAPAAPQAAAKPVAAPPAPKKEAAAPEKKEAAKPAAPPAPKKEEPKAVKTPAAVDKPVTRKKPEAYTIFAGEFPAGEETAAAEAKIAKLAIKPVTRYEKKKSTQMNRLFYGAYTDYDVYSAELDKLRQSAKGAFGIEKDGKYYLYAGSFSSKARVEKEKKDLSAKGVTLQVQPVVLALSTVRITAGQFSSKSEADKAAARLKGEGLAVTVVPKGK